MATYAIGDIHGDVEKLDSLILHLQPKLTDTVIFLGDYINKGKYSASVIDKLIGYSHLFNAVFLRGNHDLVLSHYLNGVISKFEWQQFGGDKTDQSYRGGNVNFMPDSHKEFLNNLLSYYETDTHIFVHASYCPNTPMDQQDEEQLYWEFFHELPMHMSCKVVVCGHSPQLDYIPAYFDHQICIDTCAHYYHGKLTALCVDNNTFHQVDRFGEITFLSK